VRGEGVGVEKMAKRRKHELIFFSLESSIVLVFYFFYISDNHMLWDTKITVQKSVAPLQVELK
jgi:hypothetical protein